MDIRDNTALITGGASGLGRATTETVVKAGGNVVIMDINDREGQALASELGEAAVFARTDVTREEDIEAAIDLAKKTFGGVQFCVNCAGSGLAVRTISKTDPHSLDSFEWLIRLNLIGTFNTASKAAFAMASNTPNDQGERGVIVNVASVAAFDGQIGQAAYSASKAG